MTNDAVVDNTMIIFFPMVLNEQLILDKQQQRKSHRKP